MKILLIDEEFPYPLNSGKRLRTYNLVKQLAMTNDITYIAYGETGSWNTNISVRRNLSLCELKQLQRSNK